MNQSQYEDINNALAEINNNIVQIGSELTGTKSLLKLIALNFCDAKLLDSALAEHQLHLEAQIGSQPVPDSAFSSSLAPLVELRELLKSKL